MPAADASLPAPAPDSPLAPAVESETRAPVSAPAARLSPAADADEPAPRAPLSAAPAAPLESGGDSEPGDPPPAAADCPAAPVDSARNDSSPTRVAPFAATAEPAGPESASAFESAGFGRPDESVDDADAFSCTSLGFEVSAAVSVVRLPSTTRPGDTESVSISMESISGDDESGNGVVWSVLSLPGTFADSACAAAGSAASDTASVA